jgi:hypothetical protein
MKRKKAIVDETARTRRSSTSSAMQMWILMMMAANTKIPEEILKYIRAV